jgi:hypothetical protein
VRRAEDRRDGEKEKGEDLGEERRLGFFVFW